MKSAHLGIFALVAAAVCLIGTPVVLAWDFGGDASSEASTDVRRLPFPPIVETNKEPEVCGPVLAEIKRRTADSDGKPDLLSESSQSTWPESYWLDFRAPQYRYVTVRVGDQEHALTVFDWDVSGDGKPELLVLYTRTLSSTYRFEVLAIPRSLVVGTATMSASTYIADQDFVNDLSRKGVAIAASYAPHALFIHKGVLYMHSRHYLFSPLEPIDVHRINIVEGERYSKNELVCRFRLSPAKNPYKLEGLIPENELPKLAGFMSQAKIAGGFTGGTCRRGGSSHHWSRFTKTLWQMIYNPALPPDDQSRPKTSDLTEGDRILLSWSQSSLWDYRAYRDIVEARQQAVGELARWYREKFGVSRVQSEIMAPDALVELSTALTYRAYTPGAYLGTTSGIPPLDAELRFSLLRGRDTRTIEDLLSQGANPRADKRYFFPMEPALFFALEHPALVRLLLEHGVDVDETNYFGKTALMYAAQFNLRETARVLVKAGANPNLQTGQWRGYSRCPFKRIGRTALMYAAENADEAMMALLIDAGADRTVRDIVYGNKPGNSLSDYLARNEKLSDSEQQAIRDRWQIR